MLESKDLEGKMTFHPTLNKFTFSTSIRDDLNKLPYLTMVIKEAMRLHSPVPFIQRILTSDTEIDGKIAPAGTAVNCVIYNIHHNPVTWEDSMVNLD
ncbi:hypothetical protein RRG08_056508 [Elysia crispata]|uniref:Cytochrome P450 n=1 Tax=Elysia crispata TaxID=231223 RepID=A0AAE1BC87_9GAST|nr:hypothetical protein RRG08_056508 [Elysia crispata]